MARVARVARVARAPSVTFVKPTELKQRATAFQTKILRLSRQRLRRWKVADKILSISILVIWVLDRVKL